MRNDYTNTKATKGRGGTMDGVGNGLGSNVFGRRHSIPGSDTPNRNKGKRFGVEELPRSALSRRNSVPIRTKDSVQGGARIQGGNIQNSNETQKMIHKNTFPGLAETLLLIWVAFLLLTTRLPSAHITTQPGHMPINPTVEADAVRSAIDSGRKELKFSAKKQAAPQQAKPILISPRFGE